MKRVFISILALAFVLSLATPALAAPLGSNRGFVHGIAITLDGTDYYLAGAPDGSGGAYDIPGHYWVLAGKNQLVGKHYNTGPFGAANWWSSDAADGELLYIVHAIIDTWSPENVEAYTQRGYIHYHELIEVGNPAAYHPNMVVWLKHTARTSFTLDGGPAPAFAHSVTPGIDYEFIPNANNPYP